MESIGHILKAARERRQMSVSDVAAATKMKIAFVEAIEADNFGALVAPVYARGFIKLYAESVGVDPLYLLKQINISPARPQPPAAARTVPAPPKAVRAHPGKPQPEQPAPRPARRWPTPDWTFITRMRWPRFKKPDWAFRQIQLPLVVWRQIFILTGLALLIVAAVLAWEWSNRGMPAMTDACRWAADPPAPYLSMEARPASSGR